MHEHFQTLINTLNQHIIGQPRLVERMLIALLGEGHLLVEGPPGLADDVLIKGIENAVEMCLHRVSWWALFRRYFTGDGRSASRMARSGAG